MRAPPDKREKGVAIVMALLLTALAVTIVTSLFWQQQVQVRSLENQRLQSQTEWVLRGALDWARLVLKEQGRQTWTYLGQQWNTPLAPTRLSNFIGDGSADEDDAVLTGRMTDAQSLFNLNNLVRNYQIYPPMREALGRLLQSCGVDKGIAQTVAQRILASIPDPHTAKKDQSSDQPIPMIQVQDLLSVPGVTPKVLAKFSNYVVFLPQVVDMSNPMQNSTTTLNVNTASAKVLAAWISGLTESEANTIVAKRTNIFFRTPSDFVQLLQGIAPAAATNFQSDTISTSTSYFLIYGEVQIGRAQMKMASLVSRNSNIGNSGTKLVWSKEY